MVIYQIYKLILAGKMRLGDLFREKTLIRVRVRATVNLKSTHSQLQKMGWGVFIVWTKTINW